ncbi:MAG: helix-turn-helix transcriptional regulator [Thermoleophilaceae bacterium]
MAAVCDHGDPGTREGFILVLETPPKNSSTKRNGTNGEIRRDELADFLRRRRESIQPHDVGLPNGGRRRTPGLRREEVAQLAGVGTTWYTWLEQGRDVRASLDVLESIAQALRLTPAERGHLILLGRGEQAPSLCAPAEKVSTAVRRLIENLGPNPAYVIGRRWDILTWNRAYAAVFGDPADTPKQFRNSLWLTFMDPARREIICDWERGARLLVARFRADSAKHIGDPAFEELIAALNDSSPEFRKWWKRHEVASSGEGRKTLEHPVAGKLLFEHAVFRPAEQPEQRVAMFSPLPEEDTPAKLAKLLAE